MHNSFSIANANNTSKVCKTSQVGIADNSCRNINTIKPIAWYKDSDYLY